MDKPAKLPTQADIKKAIKGAFQGGADRVRLEAAGFVIEATRGNADTVTENPLDHWRRRHGEG